MPEYKRDPILPFDAPRDPPLHEVAHPRKGEVGKVAAGESRTFTSYYRQFARRID